MPVAFAIRLRFATRGHDANAKKILLIICASKINDIVVKLLCMQTMHARWVSTTFAPKAPRQNGAGVAL
jgi:hypothetical protein